MKRTTIRTVPLVAVSWLALAAAPASAQEGVGATGAQVLQLVAGSRAAAFSGAYTAAEWDADVLFYNPAGAASLDAAASVAYQRHTSQGITFGTAAGAYRVGSVVFGIGAAYLDGGEIDVIEPDPRFGGERGEPTGETATAGESAARLSAAIPLLDGRLRLGAGAGFVTTTLAEVSRSTAIFDAGAQYALPGVTLGASVRNFGPEMSGPLGGDVPLPTEARAGATVRLDGTRGLGAVIAADVISRLNEGTTGVVAGVEAGLMPDAYDAIGAVFRAGYGLGAEDALGALRVGAGFSRGPVAIDYTFQQFEYFGAVHRVGIRWTGGTR